MKKITKIAALAVGTALAAQAAHAAAGDLLLGLANNDNGGKNDYILDLGAWNSLTAGATVDSGVTVSSLETDLTGTPAGGSGWDAGLVSGLQIGGTSKHPTPGYALTTVLDNGTGTPTAPGSTSPGTVSSATINNAASVIANLPAGEQQTSALTSWSYNVAQDPTTKGSGANSFVSELGTGNPMSAFTGNTLTLDLWEASTTTAAWTYEGDIVLNLSGTDLEYTYDPAVSAVPESSAYGVLAGAGLLVVALGRQLRRKTA